MTDPLIGQTFDRYQIVSPLGDGQFGAAYKAFDPTLQRDVAIKLIPLPEGRPDLPDAIMRQARLAARLDYPGLVKVHDFGRAGPWLYVVMDYLPGGNLSQLLQDLRAHNQWLSLAEAIGLVRQLALVFDYLGRQGLPPRGLKPADVMLKPDPFEGLPYRAVLTSLGLELDDLGAGGAPANPGRPAPAYAYWSPEQTLGEPLDARSEVYSLAALLYELAVGWQPFPAQTPDEAVRLHTQTMPPPPSTRRADLPVALEAVILKALDKDRANRYPDPAALAQALTEVIPLAQEVDLNPASSAWAASLLVPYQRSLAGQPEGSPPTRAPLPPPGEGVPPPAEGRAFFRFNGVVVDANLVQTSPDGHVGVYVEIAQFTVTPGQPTSTGIVLVNLGPEPAHFSLGLSGVPDGWLASPLPPTSIPLAPGDSRRVTVTIAPPRSPTSRAGHYTLTMRVASQTQPEQLVDAKLTLTIAAFSQFQTELSSASVQAGQPARLLVHNQGNTPEAYVVNFDDPDARLAFDPPYINLSVPEGQVGAADFTARRRQTRLLGDHRIYPYGLRIAASAGQVQKLTAEVVTHALIPVWLLLLALFGCCLLAGAAALAYNGVRAGPENTATAAAQQTAQAMARQTVSAVGTQLALRGTLTPTASATITLAPSTVTGTFLPATDTLTPQPATPSSTPPPATPSGTPPPASATFSPLPPSATFTPAPATDTATLVPPSATPLPPTVTLTLAPLASPTATPPTGGRLLFVSLLTGQPNIYFMNGDGSGVTPLTSAGSNQNPTWSLAAQRIAFESTRDGNRQIYLMHLDGSSQTRLTNNSAADISPVWSPDGAHLAFVSNRDGNPEIYIMNADGSAQTRLTNNSASDTSPAWSPDSTRLAFVTDRDGNPEIYMMNADGSSQTRLTNDAVAESDPAWAPNGAWLAYVRDVGAQSEIYLTTANGAGQLRLTNNSAADTQPVWASNSSRLAFVSERDGNPEIYTMLADGSAQTRLTNSAGHDDHPLWSPTGDRVVYASDRDGSPQIYVMNADGSSQTRLTNDGSTDLPAVWLP
jgi:Tol biopolymer transport system component/serine/threonine protein kinase